MVLRPESGLPGAFPTFGIKENMIVRLKREDELNEIVLDIV